MNEEISKESISTIIRLKDQLLTEKYNELHTATSQQKIMKVFLWGGVAFIFIGMMLQNGMSTTIEIIWTILTFCSFIYGVVNMPKDEDLRKIEDEIETAKREIEKLKGQQ